MMLLDDLPADAQAEAGSAVAIFIRILGRVEWFEDQAQLIDGDADARIREANLGHASVEVFTDIDSEPAAAGHRLPGVDDEIDQNLLDLAGDDRRDRPRMISAID